MQGKYSPTVWLAYRNNQNWFKSVAVNDLDPKGFDSYGYNSDRFDRAGYREDEYYDTKLYDLVWDRWQSVDVSKDS